MKSIKGKCILMVGNDSLGFNRGYFHIARYLAEKGAILTLAMNHVGGKHFDEQKYLSDCQKYGIFSETLSFSAQETSFLKQIVLIFRFQKILKKIKPDIVLTYTLKPNLYFGLLRFFYTFHFIPVITGLGRIFSQPTFLRRLLQILFFISLKHSKQVWVLNKSHRSFLQKKTKVKEILISPDCGVDETVFFPARTQKKDNSANHSLQFLYLGRLIKAKGVVEYLEAACMIHQEYPETSFVLVGSLDVDDPDSLGKERLMEFLQYPFIRYLGVKKNSESILAKCDCLVLPSYGEGLPRVVLEAGAMKIPSIIAKFDGWEQCCVEHKTAMLCECEDIDSLVSIMKDFISLEPRQRERMGEFSRRFVLKHFSQKKAQDFYLNSLERSLDI